MRSENESLPVYNSSNPMAGSEEELDLGQLLSVLWAGRWKIVLAVLITCVLGVLYLIAAKPVFEANGMVQVEQDGKSMTSSMGDLASLFGAPMETEAEIQILQSRMVLNKVIDNLNLQIDAQPKYFPLFGAFIARHRGKGGALLDPLWGARSFAWSGEDIEVSRFEAPIDDEGKAYVLTTTDAENFALADPDGNEILKGKTGVLNTTQTPDGAVSLFVRDIKAHPGVRFNLIRWSRSDVLDKLADNLKVAEQGKQSGVIGIQVKGPRADYVADVVRQIEDAYVRQNVERRSAEAEQSLDFLQQQLPEIKARVDAAQARLNTYQQKQGSVNVTKESELVLQQSVDFETSKLELMGQRQQAIQRFTREHPVVKALDAQIQALESEQETIKKRTERLPETQQEVLNLMRDLEVNTQLYTTLLNSAQELQVAKAGTVGNVRIIDYPLIPSEKSKPKTILILALSVALGGFSGIAILFARRALFHGVSRPDEIESALGLHTYAAIPYAPLQRRLAQAVQRKQVGNYILAATEPNDVAIEALRSFRTSLQFALMEAPNKVIMFTGPTPGLGKSFVSVNLSAVLAASGKKTVVIDADLRRGHLHKYIGEGATPGVSDYVAGNATLDKVVRKTAVDGLSLISNGTTPPNPAELLMHERFAQLLERLSAEYELVIVDTPPILPVTDASIVGRLAGSVFMVLKEGEHPLKMVEESVRRLTLAGVQIRGAIFNQVGARGGAYGGYYGYGTYGYSYQNRYSAEKR